MRSLNKLSLPEKLLNSAFVTLVCIGMLSAEAYLYVSHAGADGTAGVTLKDIQLQYYGDRSASKIQTILPTMLTNAGVDKAEWPQIQQTVNTWIANGETQDEYNAKVKPFVDSHCLACHSGPASDAMHTPKLVSYDDLKAVAKVDEGMSYSNMLMGGMVHLTMLSVIFFLAGSLLVRTRMKDGLKGFLVMVPFTAMLFDFCGWFATKHDPSWAWMVMLGGALSCPVAMLEMLAAWIELWFGLPAFLRGPEKTDDCC